MKSKDCGVFAVAFGMAVMPVVTLSVDVMLAGLAAWDMMLLGGAMYVVGMATVLIVALGGDSK